MLVMNTRDGWDQGSFRQWGLVLVVAQKLGEELGGELFAQAAKRVLEEREETSESGGEEE